MARRTMIPHPALTRVLWTAAVCLAAALAVSAARADDVKPVESPDAPAAPADAAAAEFRELRNLYRADPAKAAEGFRNLSNLLTDRSQEKGEHKSILAPILARLKLTKMRT